MAISEKKMRIVINNYFKAECDVNTSIRQAFEKGFRIGVKKGLSAQPERKMGKWISTDDGWDGEYFVCSVCGCPWTLIEGSPEDNGMNFCPNCGAYMREGEKDEVD